MFGLFKSPLQQVLELIPKSEEKEFHEVVNMAVSMTPDHSTVQKTRISAAVTSLHFYRRAMRGAINMRQKDAERMKIIGLNSIRFLDKTDQEIVQAIFRLYLSTEEDLDRNSLYD